MNPGESSKVETKVLRFTFQDKPHGAGGFAKVIRGRDNVLERDIAVKVLDRLTEEFPEPDQERFRREARILAKLSHPNIPAIYDVDFSPGKFLIVFQFIEGQTLRQLIQDSGACQVGQVTSWFHQIASALEHAHSLGIVHRDIKPENIIITPDRESAYLVDFGIALTAEDARKLTQSGFAMGTPGYMSPEQAAGDPVDSRSDIYSLAVTLYEALAGRPVALAAYEDLALNEAIPPQIDELIQECLLPVDRRISSARQFSSVLSGALRPVRPLSEVLSHGRLFEIANAVESLTAADFARLPEGQQALLVAKVIDITSSSDLNLMRAGERFLQLLLTRASFLPSEEYRELVRPGMQWAFEREFDGELGRDVIRAAVADAASEAIPEAHQVLREEFIALFAKIEKDLDDRENWYLRALREVVQGLMANPSCTSGSAPLKEALKRINEIQRARVGRPYSGRTSIG